MKNFNKIKVKGENFYQKAHRPYQSPEKQALALLWLYNHFGKSHYYLPLEKGITLHFNTQGCIMPSLFEICQGFWRIKILHFHYLAIICLCKKIWPFSWRKLNIVHQRMLSANLGWNWPSGFGERFFFTSVQFHYVATISLRKGHHRPLNKNNFL